MSYFAVNLEICTCFKMDNINMYVVKKFTTKTDTVPNRPKTLKWEHTISQCGSREVTTGHGETSASEFALYGSDFACLDVPFLVISAEKHEEELSLYLQLFLSHVICSKKVIAPWPTNPRRERLCLLHCLSRERRVLVS